MDPQRQQQFRTTAKAVLKKGKGRGKGKKAVAKKPASRKGAAGKGKGKASKTGPKAKSKTAKKAVKEPRDDQVLGCPTCRYSPKGCHICRRPGYKPRRPRPCKTAA